MDIKVLRNNYVFETSRASERDLQMEHQGPFTLTLALTLVLMPERNTLVSTALFTPSDSISINTSIKIHLGSGLTQERQC